MGSTGVKVKWS